MSDQRAVVAVLAECGARGEAVVLASVVRVVGAAYRGVGARMLVRADGSTVGMVSAGCLEADLVARAELLGTGDAPVLVTYDTHAGDEVVWGLGLGCDGIVEVLLQPLAPERARALGGFLDRVLAREAPVTLATVIRAPAYLPVRASIDASSGPELSPVQLPQVGARALLGRLDNGSGAADALEDALHDGVWGDGDVLARVLADVPPAVPAVCEFSGIEVAYELVTPAVQLFICGSGPDVAPVVRLATGLGWEVTVVAPHAGAAERSERFPGAAVVACEEPDQLAGAVTLTQRTAAVVMSHDYARDRGYVDALLRSPVGYVGVMGPRRRTERMLADLAAGGRTLTAEEHARLYAPVGLDIGGDGPEAIALAIIAEVSAATGGRAGGHLRERRAPIHSSADRSASDAADQRADRRVVITR